MCLTPYDAMSIITSRYGNVHQGTACLQGMNEVMDMKYKDGNDPALFVADFESKIQEAERFFEGGVTEKYKLVLFSGTLPLRYREYFYGEELSYERARDKFMAIVA